MSATTPETRHLDDGLLVRLLDGELAGDAVAAVGTHLDRCAECRDRYATLREQTESLHALLDRSEARLDPPELALEAAPPPGSASTGGAAIADSPPSIRRWRPAAAVAAAIAVLVAAGLLAPPVRAWVGEQLALFTGTADSAPPGTPTGTTVVRFTAGPRPIVRVEAVGAGAVLELRRVAGGEAVVEIPGGAGDVLVRPDGIRIRGAAPGDPAGAVIGDAVVYRLGLPPGVAAVELRRDGRPPVVLDVPEDAPTRVPLGPAP